MVIKAKKQGTKEKLRFRVSGEAYWAHVTEVNKLSNKFQVDFSIKDYSEISRKVDGKKEVLASGSDECIKFLEKLGIEVKTADKDDEGKPENHRGQFVTLKSEYPPKLFDSKNKEITTSLLIGNGSRVNVGTHPFEWKFGRDTGTSLGLDAIQIIDLVPYKDSMGDTFDEEDGYTAEDTSEFEDESSTEERPSRTPKVSKNNPF